MIVEKETIEKMAHLARLEVSESEMPGLQKEMGQILSWMEKLNEIDTDSVEPLIHMSSEINAFRPDLVGEPLPKEVIFQNAPDSAGPFFVVPRVVNKKG